MADPIPFKAYYEYTQVGVGSAATLSPDGEQLAFVASEFDAAADERLSSVFVVDTDGDRPPHRLTQASAASNPKWNSDGTKLAVLAAREDAIGYRVGGPDEDEADADGQDDEPRPQVWIFDLERGGDPRQVTDFEEGVREFDWGPENRRLVVSARDPTDEQAEYLTARREGEAPIETERLQHKADGTGWLDDVTTYLFVVDIDSRDVTRLDDAFGQGAREPFVGLQPRWSPAGEEIAFVSNRTDRPDDSNVMDLYTIAPDGENLRRVTDGEVRARSLEYSPSGDRLAFVNWDPDNWYQQMEVYVTTPGHDTYGSVSASLDRTVQGFHGLTWATEDRLLGAIGDEGLTRLALFDPAGGTATRVLPAQGRDRDLVAFDTTADTVAVGLSDPTEGTDFYAGAAELFHDEGSLTQLTDLNHSLRDQYAFPTTKRLTVTTDDGTEVEAIAYLPPDFDPADPDPRPTIVSIHGGPMAYDTPSFEFDTACWTSRGYVVLQPNYRGSTSYGQAFCETLRGRWGSVEVTDQAACTREAINRGWADPDRLFVTGFSYGGISAGFLVTQTDLFAAGAAEHGIYDLQSSFGTGDSHNWFENEFGLPWENEKQYATSSSITDVATADTPLLITAGGQDWRCPPTQSEQLYVSLKKRDVPAKLIVYEDEHHAVTDPDRMIHRLENIDAWFERFDPTVESSE